LIALTAAGLWYRHRYHEAVRRYEAAERRIKELQAELAETRIALDRLKSDVAAVQDYCSRQAESQSRLVREVRRVYSMKPSPPKPTPGGGNALQGCGDDPICAELNRVFGAP